MTINDSNVSRHELIGLRVRISSSSDPSHKGAGGRVVDETRNTLVLMRDGSRRTIRVPKEGSRFQFTLPDGRVSELEGRSLAFRPEDRVKRCR